MENTSELIIEVTRLIEKISSLTTALDKLVKEVDSQDKRVHALEKSKTQLIAIISVFATMSSIGVWALNAHITQVVRDEISADEVVRLICKEHRNNPDISHDDLPKLCQ